MGCSLAFCITTIRAYGFDTIAFDIPAANARWKRESLLIRIGDMSLRVFPLREENRLIKRIFNSEKYVDIWRYAAVAGELRIAINATFATHQHAN